MGKVKIYLDVCSYNRPFDDQSQVKVRLETEAKLHIQSCVRKNKYSLTWSYMLDMENEDSPYEERKKAIALWKEIADVYCPSSDCILRTGQKIMKFGIKAMDALVSTLGAVDAERFISMVKRDSFDYTEWQRKLWDGKSIEEIHAMATEHEMSQV